MFLFLTGVLLLEKGAFANNEKVAIYVEKC